ncbi:MAG: gluconeogenesis factor YvcK family protein [Candidatus Saccharibacteria bacterium]
MGDPFQPDQVKIAVIGGGTGSFTLLSALKDHTNQIAALVNMVDDGGSTGVLRDEFGTLPPGDVRQCLVALSTSPKVRELFNYRFEEGTFGGHSFGNILLTALEKTTGSFNEAVETASEILRVRGTVVPMTLEDVRLKMEWPEASLILQGERVIDAEHFKNDPRKATLSLVPEVAVNPTAVKAILQADLVLIAPGDLYTSLGPLLIVPEISQALKTTQAIKIYVSNLVTKQGQTDGFSVSDHADEIERLGGGHFLDYVLYNSQQPTAEQAARYKKEGAYVVPIDQEKLDSATYRAVDGEFLGQMAQPDKGDIIPVTRTLIRHNSKAVVKAIMDLHRRAKNVKFYR